MKSIQIMLYSYFIMKSVHKLIGIKDIVLMSAKNKLKVYKNEYGPLLFDRASDPYEMDNLAGDPHYTRIQNELEARLQKWMQDIDDPFDSGPRDEETEMLMLGQEFNDDRYKEFVE